MHEGRDEEAQTADAGQLSSIPQWSTAIGFKIADGSPVKELLQRSTTRAP